MNIINEIIHWAPLKRLRSEIFAEEKTELVVRPASFLVKKRDEGEDILQRIIILPPRGYTADHIDELVPHPEARRAKVSVIGGARSGKIGFSILKNILKYCYLTGRNAETIDNHPYVRISKGLKTYCEQTRSAREIFFTVRENGTGFYHNLINVTDDWLVLILEKELRFQKIMDIESTLVDLNQIEQTILRTTMALISSKGDRIFTEHANIVERVSILGPQCALPALIEGLNIQDCGRHEACSVYAMILKCGRKYPRETLNSLKSSLRAEKGP